MDKYKKLYSVAKSYQPFYLSHKKYGWWSLYAQLFLILVSIVGPILMSEVINNLSDKDFKSATYYFIFYATLILLYRVGDYFFGVWASIFQARTMNSAGKWVYDNFLQRSMNFYSDNFSGKLVNKIDKYLTAFEYLHDILVQDIISSFAQILGAIIVLLFIDYRLAIVFGIWIVFQLFISTALISKKIPISIAKAKAQSNFIGVISDLITNAMANISYVGRIQEMNIFSKSSDHLEKKRTNDWIMSAKVGLITNFTASSFSLAAQGLTIYLFINGNVALGTVVLISSYSANIRQSIRSLTRSLDVGSTQLSNALEMTEILDRPLEILDYPSATTLQVTSGAITFNQTTFNYTGQGSDEIDNLDLVIAPGESIGLVGHSGAGKSTIVKLLLRFVDVTDGSIKIDNQDIRDVTQESLRQNIAYVPQEPLLFHRSLRDNIAYGKPDANLDEVIQAAKQANAHEFIKNLEHGYDTLVGERGVKLSGGQRQRVAIARAILKDAPILILDEATSSLDSKSEREIQTAIANLIQGKTVIAIAHRLSTIKHLDRIIVLENGSIAQQGSHDELIAQGGIYADLWEHQYGGFLE